MKVVIIVAHFPPKWLAGTEIATYNLAEHLAERGHEIHVITSYDEGLLKCHQEKGFYIHRVSFPRINIIGYFIFWTKLFFIIKKFNPDIVHAQNLIMSIPAYGTKKILKIPYIVWGRGSDVYLPEWYIRITRKPILQNAAAVLALTEDMRNKLKKIYPREIYVVPNGINLEQFNDVLVNSINDKSTKNILFVGRLHPVKGIQYLIKAMKRVLEEIPDAMLILVGDGEDRERLEALSIDFGLQEFVQFIGEVPHENVRNFMLKANIFVLPSLSESFGMVNLEAMACGLPIVATRVGGIPNVIKNGINGYLIEVKDSDAIADSIIILLTDENLRNTISNNNKQYVKNFTWNNIIIKLEKIYQISIK